MQRVRELAERAVASGRRAVAAPEWPVLLALLLGVLAVAELFLMAGDSGAAVVRGPRPFGGADPDGTSPAELVLPLCATLPLAMMRLYVVATAATITAAMIVTVTIHQPPTTAALAALVISLYLVGRHRPRPVAPLLVLPFVAYALTRLGASEDEQVFALLLLTVSTAAVAAGAIRRARTLSAERDASMRTLEVNLLDHVARGERARIARELHDVVAHHISMIAVQAETARLTTADLPAEGARRLSAIGDTARSALTEMRRLLGVLREDAGPPPSTREPQPGLEQLNALIDQARESAGASTRLIVRGSVGPLDPGVELTAYRVVQEALTNARRHAPGAAVDVELDYGEAALRIRIRDNGPGPASPRPDGHGLVGMRERAGMVGGTLRAGPTPVGGFLIDVTLPTTGARA